MPPLSVQDLQCGDGMKSNLGAPASLAEEPVPFSEPATTTE